MNDFVETFSDKGLLILLVPMLVAGLYVALYVMRDRYAEIKRKG